MKDIAVELSKQGQVEESASVMQESLAIACDISDEFYKSSALKDIAIELSRQGYFAKAEAVALDIPQIAKRHNAWKEIAKSRVEADGWQKALVIAAEFLTEEAKLFYLRGWSENVSVTDATDACIQEASPLLVSDNVSIENLLQKHALLKVCFGNPSRELTNRLNRILNIQWALDIAAQFPKSTGAQRLSTNLEEWLPQVEDEDTRDQIELWARQVSKGKITEEQFQAHLKNILT